MKTMEGSFVKKQRPLLFLLCLLMATAGCHHKPVKAIVLIPTADNEMPSVKAQAGGVVEFRMDEGTPANSSFVVQFSRQICDPSDKLEGSNTQPVICHITAQGGDYNVSITILKTIGDTTSKHGHRVPPKGLQLYVRPCKNCGH
ncbi:MAG: hypothetical protein WB950_08145 [Acidobacteriaceae bacterium]